MSYYVTKENVEMERHQPNSTVKKADTDGGLFLWNQSMFILAQLLTAGLLHINELDPIRRYLPSYNRPKKGGRYSAFQVKKKYIYPFDYFLFCFKIYQNMLYLKLVSSKTFRKIKI